MQSIIDQVIARRKDIGVTKEAVAVYSGLHFNTIIQFEKGNRSIGADSLARIATALSCRIVLEPFVVVDGVGSVPRSVAPFMEGV
jgi:transcriptional regulator with XRE-family HTH domain